jgi:hypothetical protein
MRNTWMLTIATFAAGVLAGALAFPGAPPAARVTPPEPAAPSTEPVAKTGTLAAVRPATEPDPVAEETHASPAASDALASRLDELSQGWGRMQAELADLRQRVALIEQREATAAAVAKPENTGIARPKTPDEQREALLKAGVAPKLTEDVLLRQSQDALARLELRDQAVREGWLDSDRYREELGRINAQRLSLRDEIGVDAYDRYLFETGQDNRIRVDAVIPGSNGEESGILAGDIIERYANQNIFDFRDLRAATSDGERGELVPVVVRRGGEQLELWLQRGPIGIQLDSLRADPSQ